MANRPGKELSNRPLHLIWIVDCSGSMQDDGKMQSLNTAIRESLPHMKVTADENPNAQVLVRTLKFSSGATWHTPSPVPVEQFMWDDLQADGVTDMGKAFSLVAEQLKIPPMTDRALPPVLVLVSDGGPTDNYKQGLAELMALPWGIKSVRIAIAIGENCNKDVLVEFIGNSEIKPCEARNPEALAKYIRWVSTVVLKEVSAPASKVMGAGELVANVQLPVAPDPGPASATEPW